ncbi:hypothetical protein PVAP13_9NG551384 [Panicum virgatum]|uniref:Uncharacterized protein n=1 Tax=Panicum virgatum TaxID=38727 RepID=A0A8T0MXS7_PANVG|nr:hypothetical protein PVAP13_9NG551384 [Panicum virgatum]
MQMLAIISLCCTGLLLLAVSIPSHLIIYSSVDRTYSTNMLIGNLTGPKPHSPWTDSQCPEEQRTSQQSWRSCRNCTDQ